MQLRKYLDPGLVFIDPQAADKPGLLRELAQRAAARAAQIDEDDLHARLKAREEKDATTIGRGIAVPHAFLDGLREPVCAVAQVPAGLDWGSTDGEPVHLLFMLLSPTGATMTHLRLLARISRVASRETFPADAAQVSSPEQLHDLIVREDESHVD